MGQSDRLEIGMTARIHYGALTGISSESCPHDPESAGTGQSRCEGSTNTISTTVGNMRSWWKKCCHPSRASLIRSSAWAVDFKIRPNTAAAFRASIAYWKPSAIPNTRSVRTCWTGCAVSKAEAAEGRRAAVVGAAHAGQQGVAGERPEFAGRRNEPCRVPYKSLMRSHDPIRNYVLCSEVNIF
jgi:hypothetical protein